MRLDLDAIRERWKETCLDMDAMLAELERLYKSAEPVQPTPQEQEAAIAGELRRTLWKPRGRTYPVEIGLVCPTCGSASIHVEYWAEGDTIYTCRDCGREW